MALLRLLPPTLINQIAAGEVVERPASVLKELLENALDAGATSVDIRIRDGGKSYLSVLDNGSGMTADELDLAVERHATSKIPDDNLWAIKTFGFRGEALPSIGSVARLTLSSRLQGHADGWCLTVEGGHKGPVKPVSMGHGTKVEVRDLFFATPARLKFLKSTMQETKNITEIIERLALKHVNVAFKYFNDEKEILNLQPATFHDRMTSLMGSDLSTNHLNVKSNRNAYSSWGILSLPTLHKNTSMYQHLYVNGRYVKDKLFHQCLRVAYQDLIPGNRFSMAVIFLDLPLEDVDINVHPSKTEVRFKDAGFLRAFLLESFKETLSTVTYRAADTLRQQALNRATAFVQPAYQAQTFKGQGFQPTPSHLPKSYESNQSQNDQNNQDQSSLNKKADGSYSSGVISVPSSDTFDPTPFDSMLILEQGGFPSTISRPAVSPNAQESAEPFEIPPLGFAKAQLLETYIVSENSEGLVITDQHAVHERIVYEKFKKDIETNGVKRQVLLVPEIIQLKPALSENLEPLLPSFISMGLLIETFGQNSFLIREVPAQCQGLNWSAVLEDMAHECGEGGDPLTLKTKLFNKLSLAACHGSIRAGQKLSIEEMNALLRQMETTTFAGQCNHGRPTYVVLRKQDLEKLFHRS